ncbi:MAG: pyruvate, water dikinase regulatory protein [Azospirillaceae bacterium]
MNSGKTFHLHMVSDATGETIQSVARACLAQFDEVAPVEHFWNLVRTDRQLALALEEIETSRGIVIYTLVDAHLRQRLEETCRRLQVPCISILDPVLHALTHFLDMPSQSRPGRQHAMDAAYFYRMDAMDFALAHDDGQRTDNLHEADVVLVGVSRTSKTPTTLYLANRGVKAANVPYVPGRPMPRDLDTATHPLIVGLTKDPDRLVQIRRSRLTMLRHGGETEYTDPELVRAEVLEARRYYSRRGWPVIDVTRRAIEETAAEIMTLLAHHRDRPETEDAAGLDDRGTP